MKTRKTPAAEFVDTISSPTEEDVAALANQLWEQEGRPEGRAEEHWQRAQAQLRGESAGKEPKVV
jgi:hypothetical protein